MLHKLASFRALAVSRIGKTREAHQQNENANLFNCPCGRGGKI